MVIKSFPYPWRGSQRRRKTPGVMWVELAMGPLLLCAWHGWKSEFDCEDGFGSWNEKQEIQLKTSRHCDAEGTRRILKISSYIAIHSWYLQHTIRKCMRDPKIFSQQGLQRVKWKIKQNPASYNLKPKPLWVPPTRMVKTGASRLRPERKRWNRKV